MWRIIALDKHSNCGYINLFPYCFETWSKDARCNTMSGNRLRYIFCVWMFKKSQIKIENCESVFHVERPVSPKYDGINRHRHHVKLRRNEIIHSCFTMINGQHCSNLDGLIAKTCPVVPAYIGK